MVQYIQNIIAFEPFHLVPTCIDTILHQLKQHRLIEATQHDFVRVVATMLFVTPLPNVSFFAAYHPATIAGSRSSPRTPGGISAGGRCVQPATHRRGRTCSDRTAAPHEPSGYTGSMDRKVGLVGLSKARDKQARRWPVIGTPKTQEPGYWWWSVERQAARQTHTIL